jgi:hypothetical protein
MDAVEIGLHLRRRKDCLRSEKPLHPASAFDLFAMVRYDSLLTSQKGKWGGPGGNVGNASLGGNTPLSRTIRTGPSPPHHRFICRLIILVSGI